MLTQQAPAVGRFRITKEIKQDSFGILYEAYDGASSERVSLRVISPEISGNENFIVRFELLKRVLKKLSHPHLLQIKEIGCDNNLFYISKEIGAGQGHDPMTLDDIDILALPGRFQALELIFEGIASGLSALEQVSDSYYKSGIAHDWLTPEKILIHFEKSLVGSVQKPVPKIDGYAETFLFFGDTPEAILHRRIYDALHQWKAQGHRSSDLFKDEPFLFPGSREGALNEVRWHQYSFGVLAYKTLTGHSPRGVYPSVRNFNASLDPLWDEIINRCLSAVHGAGYASMKQVMEQLKELSSKQNRLSPAIRKIKEKKAPKGMTLILCEEKVELGSMDGPIVERPSFKARIKPFFIDIFPITCGQFQEFLPHYQRSSYSRNDNHPATMASWNMAKAYCRWRSDREGLPTHTYRLPTEYEWEAAARGTTGHQYPWGADFDPHKCHCSKGQEEGTVSVNHFPPGRFGLYDLLGNAWEWTESIFKPHPFSKHIEKEYSQGLYVVKGGCWYTPALDCRASLRAAYRAQEQRGNIGFRCVRNAWESETEEEANPAPRSGE